MYIFIYLFIYLSSCTSCDGDPLSWNRIHLLSRNSREMRFVFRPDLLFNLSFVIWITFDVCVLKIWFRICRNASLWYLRKICFSMRVWVPIVISEITMETHHNNNGLSSMENKAGPSNNEHCSNNPLDDAVGKLLQGIYIHIYIFFSVYLINYNR